MADSERWPSIPVADWQDTGDTLHLCAEKVADALGVAILMNGGPGTVHAPRAFDAFREFNEK